MSPSSAFETYTKVAARAPKDSDMSTATIPAWKLFRTSIVDSPLGWCRQFTRPALPGKRSAR
jgi:hypothetical protein